VTTHRRKKLPDEFEKKSSRLPTTFHSTALDTTDKLKGGRNKKPGICRAFLLPGYFVQKLPG